MLDSGAVTGGIVSPIMAGASTFAGKLLESGKVGGRRNRSLSGCAGPAGIAAAGAAVAGRLSATGAAVTGSGAVIAGAGLATGLSAG